MTFTPAELNLLQARMAGCCAGLQRELKHRRHPLTGMILPHDQRYDLAELIRLICFYRHLSHLAGSLAHGQTLPAVDNPAAAGLLQFLIEELELTHAAAAYVVAQHFTWRTKANLLRTLDVEARFFTLVIDHLLIGNETIH